MKLIDRAIWFGIVVVCGAVVLPAALPPITLAALAITACVIATRLVWFWTGRW